jgi:hypothetical protein
MLKPLNSPDVRPSGSAPFALPEEIAARTSAAPTAAGRADNRVIQTLWIGPLSPLEQMCMTSFVQQGHEFHLYAYQQHADVPAGVRVLDAREILPPATIFRNRRGRGKGSYAGFADLFRYKLLWQRGGWWVDADVFCLRPFDFAADYVFGAEDKPVANGVLKAPAGCELMRRCYTEAACYDHRGLLWNELGDILARAVSDLGLERYVLSSRVFSPIAFDEVADYVRGRRSFTMPADSYAVHLYNEMLRRKRLSKYRDYPAGSVLAQLRQRVGLPARLRAPSLGARRWLDQLAVRLLPWFA